MSIIQSVFLAQEVNGMNLTSYLAEQGDDKAVQKLIALGGKLDDAAYGYAMAGNKEQLVNLLEACPESQHAACIGKMVRGFARTGRFDEIYELENYRQYKDDLLIGLAQSGNQTKITPLLDREITLFAQVVEGYASCNQGQLLTKLIKGTSYYPLAIYHAARSGHTDLVNDLLVQCGIDSDYRLNVPSSPAPATIKDINAYALLNWALKGYMAGRYFNDAVKLLERGASVTQCVLDLKDTNGSPSHELYFAFLAHVKDSALRETVLNKMVNQAVVMESLQITRANKEELEKVITCMNDSNLNYIEARSQVESSSNHAVEGALSLSFLAEVVKSELPEIDCQSSINHNKVKSV